MQGEGQHWAVDLGRKNQYTIDIPEGKEERGKGREFRRAARGTTTEAANACNAAGSKDD
jgi:hypothetical protein